MKKETTPITFLTKIYNFEKFELINTILVIFRNFRYKKRRKKHYAPHKNYSLHRKIRLLSFFKNKK